MIDFSDFLESSEDDASRELPRREAIEALTKTEKIQVTGELLSTFVAKVRKAQDAADVPGVRSEDFLRESELELLEIMGGVLLEEASKRYSKESG